jgi:tetratricopeptide (TPR) repeat protein
MISPRNLVARIFCWTLLIGSVSPGTAHTENLPASTFPPFWSEQHFIELFDKVVESVIGDLAGFIAFGLVLSYLLRKHLGEKLEKGLASIGDILANKFSEALATPFIRQTTAFADVMKKMLAVQATPGLKQNIGISAEVRASLDHINSFVEQKKYDEAFAEVLILRGKYPSELEILRKIIEVSELLNVDPANRLKTLRIIQDAEADFSGNPDYFVLLAMCFIGAKESGPRGKMYKDGLSAAEKARALETNIDKIPRRVSVISMVHFYFSNVAAAIKTVEDSLEMLAPLTSPVALESTARAKNNLAYYLAERGNLADKLRTIELAKAALEHDEKTGAANYLPTDWDTLGYVLLRLAESKDEVINALHYFEKAQTVTPDDIDYNKHIAIAKATLLSFS